MSTVPVWVKSFAATLPVSRKNGELKLLHLTKRIHDLLSITKLLTVFDTYDTESEAVKSFK